MRGTGGKAKLPSQAKNPVSGRMLPGVKVETWTEIGGKRPSQEIRLSLLRWI